MLIIFGNCDVVLLVICCVLGAAHRGVGVMLLKGIDVLQALSNRRLLILVQTHLCVGVMAHIHSFVAVFVTVLDLDALMSIWTIRIKNCASHQLKVSPSDVAVCVMLQQSLS